MNGKRLDAPLHEFTRLRAMLAGWKNTQSICTVLPNGVQAEMEKEIANLENLYNVKKSELAKAVDPHTSRYMRFGITS